MAIDFPIFGFLIGFQMQISAQHPNIKQHKLTSSQAIHAFLTVVDSLCGRLCKKMLSTQDWLQTVVGNSFTLSGTVWVKHNKTDRKAIMFGNVPDRSTVNGVSR